MRKLLFIFVLFFFVDASRSQVIDGVEIVKPRIITGDWDSVTKKFPVAVEFTIVKDWHLYWLNPGDAGSPPEVKWSLPDGWSAEPLQFPVPKHVVEDGFESYVYYDKLVLYTEITSPRAPLPSDVIEADIKWMVCKDICVAGKQLLTSSYEITRTPHVWPKLPLVPTLEEAGIQTTRDYELVNSSASGGGPGAWAMLTLPGQPVVSNFYKLIDSDRPIYADAYFGTIRIGIPNDVSPVEIILHVNGLVFIDDKVYWLKAP